MKNIKKYDEFNEELNFKKAVAGTLLAGSLLAGGGAYVHDKMVEPTEQTQTNHIDLPNSFRMEEKILSFGTDMYVTNKNRDNFGKVEERTFNITKVFEYKDNTGKLIATAKEQFFALVTKINIYDENEKFIGSVEKQFLESLLSPIYSVYLIKDANGDVIAESEKLSMLTTDVELSSNGQTIAKFNKKFLSVSDSWRIEINSNIDKRLIIFIPSFISSKSSSSSSSSKSK